MKLGLWKKFEHNRDGYTNAKTNFIRKWTETAKKEIKMNEILKKCYLEEDLFPKLFAKFEERPYGILFYNPENRDSYDSNHAVIYCDKIDDLPAVLKDIREFYKSKGSNAIIYQSMLDDAYFEEIKSDLFASGFKSWSEEQKYMLPLEENKLTPPENISVRRVNAWSDDLKQVFIEAEEPWEIPVLERSIQNKNYWCFAAAVGEKTVGVLYGYVSENACRVDYLLVSKKHRGIGAGNALFNEYVNWAHSNGIKNDYIWPDGDIPEKIYTKAGYRVVEVRRAGRAVFQTEEDFLRETKCIDFSHPLIAKKIAELKNKSATEIDYIKNAYEYVRDEITHSWDVRAEVVSKTASEVLQNGTGICWAKSCLLAALLRGNKIPCGITYQKLTRADDASDGYIIHALNTVYIFSLKKWIRLDARGNKATVHAEFSIDEEKLAFPVRAELNEVDYLNNDVDLDARLVKILNEVDVVMNIRTDFEL